jgi:hypothetical protein
MAHITKKDGLTIWRAQTSYRLTHLVRGLCLVPLLGLTLGGRWDLALLFGVTGWLGARVLGWLLRSTGKLLRRRTR